MTTRPAVAVVASSILLAACGSDGTLSSATPAASPTKVSPQVESSLEGTWQAGPVRVDETVATLHRHGLGRWVEDYRAHAPFTGDTVLTLTIEEGAWNLYGASTGQEPQPIDYDAEYEIDGDTVVFHHSDGSNTYRWEVQLDTLRLRFVRSTLPGYRGIPDEVFQRALYTTETFSRRD